MYLKVLKITSNWNKGAMWQELQSTSVYGEQSNLKINFYVNIIMTMYSGHIWCFIKHTNAERRVEKCKHWKIRMCTSSKYLLDLKRPLTVHEFYAVEVNSA